MTTKIIIPRASGEGGLGIEDTTWGHAYFNSGNFNELDVTTNATIGESLTVGGNLTVNGTTTTVNSSVINVDDKNIELGAVDSPTDVTADGGGITLKGDTDKTIIWSAESDDWKFNKGIRSFNTAGGNDIVVTKDVGGTEVVSAGLISDADGDGSLILSNNVGNTRVSLSSIADSYFMGGKIGIGTASPYLGLSIEGSAWATSSLGLTRTDGGEHSDSSLVFGSAAGTNAGHAIGGIWFKNTDQSTYGAIIRARTDDASGVTGRIEFLSGGSVGNSSTPSMTIKGDGKVGIGTTSPNGTLTVRNDSSNIAQLILGNTTNTGGRDWRLGRDNVSTGHFIISYSDATNNNNTTEALRIDGNGNIGIGTNNPSGTLELSSTSTDTNLLMGGTPLSGTREPWRFQAEGDNLHIGQNKSSFAKYLTFNGGNVGIGTASPNSKLEINARMNGSGYALKIDTETRALSEGYIWLGRSAEPDFYINSSGKIGMGTATPEWTLDVECPTGSHAGIRALQSSTTDLAAIRTQNDIGSTFSMFARGSGETGSTLGVSTSNAMQLFSTGASALLIGTNNGSSIFFSTNNTVRAYISSSGTFKVHSLSANSDVQTNASGEFITTSDKRLKNDLGDCEYGLSEITKIIPKKFAWKSDPLQSPTVGFFAQEVHEHIPEAAPKYIRKKILTEAVDASPATYWGEEDELPEGVSLGDEKLPAREGSDATYETQYDSEGNHEYDWGFNSQAIVAALVNCVKELKQENDSLKSRIDALES